MLCKERKMSLEKLKKYYLLSLLGTLLAAFYPLYMGVKVVTDMIKDGSVLAENYPKYIIPYTPISIAIIVGVVFMPAFLKYAKRFALLVASGLGIGVFFLTEILLESKVIVTSTVETTLESWQMFMCYAPPESYETRTWTTVDVLIGDYSSTFKIHFYIISIVLILSLLNCFYGFAQMIVSSDWHRLKALIIQSISSVLFLGLCIFACFTAFFRDGEITVSPTSAVLMSIFFIVFGVTMGLYTGSFLLNKKKCLSIGVPSVIAALVTLTMYIGEMMLLSGHLYRFGSGFLFDSIGGIVLAPVDVFIILLSGIICALILRMISDISKE